MVGQRWQYRVLHRLQSLGDVRRPRHGGCPKRSVNIAAVPYRSTRRSMDRIYYSCWLLLLFAFYVVTTFSVFLPACDKSINQQASEKFLSR